MIDVKNLPNWERAIRILAACTMGACGVHFRAIPLGWALLTLGGATSVTAVLAFCPSCALPDRRLSARGRTRS